MSLFKDSFVKV